MWVGRYRIVGKDSAKVPGKAWTKRRRAPEGYLTRLEKELRPRWGELPVASVTREDFGEYRAELVARDLAATTLNQSRTIVRGIFLRAVDASAPRTTPRWASGALRFMRKRGSRLDLIWRSAALLG